MVVRYCEQICFSFYPTSPFQDGSAGYFRRRFRPPPCNTTETYLAQSLSYLTAAPPVLVRYINPLGPLDSLDERIVCSIRHS